MNDQSDSSAKALRSWQEIAAELSKENDTEKVIELSRELNDVMLEEERRKAQNRFK